MRRQVRLLIGAALAASIVSASACKREREGTGAGPGEAATEGAASKGARVPLDPLPANAVRVSGKNFHVDVAPAAGCANEGACSVLADLTALSGFKVNKDYPYRFVPDAASKPLVAGEAAFAVTGTHTGRLMVPVRREAGGTATVSGTFKLSVCNAEVCQIEDAELRVAMP